MTPERLAEIEEANRGSSGWSSLESRAVTDLCAALRTAWAERDEAMRPGNYFCDKMMAERDARPSPEVVAKVREALKFSMRMCMRHGWNLHLESTREALRLLEAGGK